MPIYPYECSNCDYSFEQEQRIKDPKLVTCPKCGMETLQRLIKSTSFVLRGIGWGAHGYNKYLGNQK